VCWRGICDDALININVALQIAMSAEYSSGCAPFYDLFSDAPGAPDAGGQFVLRQISPGERVLDVGAGNGSLALALADAGHDVCAFEPDAEMRAVMLARIGMRTERDARVTICHTEDEVARVGQLFSRVICLYVLHLLPDPPNRERLLRNMVQWLASGGTITLVFPAPSTKRKARPLATIAERWIGAVRYEHLSAMSEISPDVWKTDWVFRRTNAGAVLDEISQSFLWKPIVHEEIEAWLGASSLRIEACASGFSGEVFVSGESGLCVLNAVKSYSEPTHANNTCGAVLNKKE
jgi:2-polyprenyl-3-methyl-5-hydroxy-6-metoxy-1,4-benzoquinol methylase